MARYRRYLLLDTINSKQPKCIFYTGKEWLEDNWYGDVKKALAIGKRMKKFGWPVIRL